MAPFPSPPCVRRGYPGYGGERGPRGDEEYLWGGGGGGRGPAGGWAMGAPGAGPGGPEYQLWSQGRNDGYASTLFFLPSPSLSRRRCRHCVALTWGSNRDPC